MGFTNVWTNNTNPPDSEASNLMYAEVRKLRQDVVDRLSNMTGSMASPPPFEAQFSGMIFIDTSSNPTSRGHIYAVAGGVFNDITDAILYNISQMPITGPMALTLPGGTTILSPNIQNDGADPSLLPTLSPTPLPDEAAANPMRLINADFVQTMFSKMVGDITGGQLELKIPLTWASGIPENYICIRAGAVAGGTGTGLPVVFGGTNFSATPLVAAVAICTGSGAGGNCNAYNITTAGMIINLGDGATGANWIAVGISI